MIVGRQTFEGTRSPCKQGARVAVAAVRAGAEDDGVCGECLLAVFFSGFISDPPSFFSAFSLLNFCYCRLLRLLGLLTDAQTRTHPQ